ncbi:MAG TPA: alpha/beta hydrolase [Solirubrobacterales bacterium]|nr:alpha/beta hydrolase [Solirubrobacterales bacterium]
MALPRLPPRIEHRILRVACRLPSGLGRAVLGAPPRIDGQELATEMQALLRLAVLTGEDEEVSGLPLAEARARLRAGAVAAAGPRRSLPTSADVAIPGPAGMIPARLYDPPGAGLEERPLLVYFHGGCWALGDLDTHDGVCRFLATNAAAAVLSVGYRLAPEHPFPAAVEDAFAAFGWATAESARLGADPSRIAVAGDSAGGNLAAAVSLLARDGDGPSPAMQALLYPIVDASEDWPSRQAFASGYLLTKAELDWFELQYLPEASDRDDPRVSLLRAANLSGLPPTYIATAGFDPLRDEGQAYAAALREAGVAVALRHHPGLIHGFANMTAISRSARAAMHELAGAVRMGLG